MCALFLVNQSPFLLSQWILSQGSCLQSLLCTLFWTVLGDLSLPHRTGLVDTWWHRTWLSSTGLCLWGSRAPFDTAGRVDSPTCSPTRHTLRSDQESNGQHWVLLLKNCRQVITETSEERREVWRSFQSQDSWGEMTRLGRLLEGAASWSSPVSDAVSGQGCWKQKTHGFVDEKPVYS